MNVKSIFKSTVFTLAALLVLFGPDVSRAQSKIAMHDSPAPSINGPRIVGSTPGRPFLFLIPATGEGPLTFSAEGLPAGLSLDPATGIISGSIEKDGKYVARVTVIGPRGSDTRNLNIVGGWDKLALTPPMGWNAWNVWGTSISDVKTRDAADAMVESGLAAHGYQYVNIDDGWQSGNDEGIGLPAQLFKQLTGTWATARDHNGEILPNEKFPDMKTLADYVHSRGLKLGIYTSPGPKTCAMYEGSMGHEEQDARSYAEWGIDYLKYDMCSYNLAKLPTFKFQQIKPYREMGIILENVDRDIVYSICQYGMAEVWTWGEQVGGNLWRTTGDVKDVWAGKKFYPIGITRGFEQGEIAPYAGPGHWNDPDMLVVGKVGWGPTLHESALSEDEQITHITIWSMLAAPLLIGCDMTEMDDFTLALLTNDEVLDVDQDPLGIQATRKAQTESTQVWSRPLWDGTIAVALFNTGEQAGTVKAEFTDLGLAGSQPVRNMWLKKDLGEFEGSFSAEVPPHGALLLKIGKPVKEDFSILD